MALYVGDKIVAENIVIGGSSNIIKGTVNDTFTEFTPIDSATPVEGDESALYIDVSKNISYQWNGAGFVEIGSSLKLGETSDSAYAGNKGKELADNLSSHSTNTEVHVTAAERILWNKAEENVQSDWNDSDENSDAFIKNKPTSLPASDVSTWAKENTKPSYTATEVGADPVGSADTAYSNAKTYADSVASSKADTSALTAHTSNTENPHNVTKLQVGLGNVEDKSSETIRGEITKTNVTDALGYTPYTPNEIDNMISALETAIDWKESVNTFDDIATTYPDPVDGWTVNVNDTDYTYRYNGSEWVAISANSIPKATNDVDGLLSKEDHANYDDANSKKHSHENLSVLNGISENLVLDWNAAKTHADSAHAPSDATKTEASSVNGNIKIDGDETVVYTHPETSGNKHIPSGGSVGQVLKCTADGTADWSNETKSTIDVLTSDPESPATGYMWVTLK